jgi:hypothetical protein
VRTSVWGSLTALPLVLGGVASGSSWEIIFGLSKAWWALPVAASSISVSALAVSMILQSDSGRGVSLQAYLVPGPAMATVNILPGILPVATAPAWAVGLMPALFFVSAWLYYRGTREHEDTDGPS